MIKLLSWNVNGIRALDRKGEFDKIISQDFFVLSLQETKSQESDLNSKLLNPIGYSSFFFSAEKKGYSGVCAYSKIKPLKVSRGLGIDIYDKEARVLILEYDKFILFNIYFPNGKKDQVRLKYKLDFYREFLNYLKLMKTDKTIVITGDFNTAHEEIDLARPKENSKFSGFLPEERSLLDELINLGFVDSFRLFNKNGGNYTWWDLKTSARERNVGWRIDYFFIDKKSVSKLKDAFILKDIFGSDHCPIGISLEV